MAEGLATEKSLSEILCGFKKCCECGEEASKLCLSYGNCDSGKYWASAIPLKYQC